MIKNTLFILFFEIKYCSVGIYNNMQHHEKKRPPKKIQI